MDPQQLSTLQQHMDKSLTDGDWAGKPAVPATTVTVTNASGHPMFVEITGGTVTAVKVDGVTIGARTSGMFYVRPESTIAWVGSAAPTWQWFVASW
jgi:hypothetical protein